MLNNWCKCSVCDGSASEVQCKQFDYLPINHLEANVGLGTFNFENQVFPFPVLRCVGYCTDRMVKIDALNYYEIASFPWVNQQALFAV